MAKAKNPGPPARFTFAATDEISYTGPLWRIHRLTGPYRQRWNELRTHGPLASRWDPHPEPTGEHAPTGVIYTAIDVVTAVAEVFQHTRAIDPGPERALSGWIPSTPLQLLDLTGDWPLVNGASASLHAATKATCRAWARALHTARPDLHGLHVSSTMTGVPMVVLFDSATATFPDDPGFSRALNHPACAPYLAAAADRLQWPTR